MRLVSSILTLSVTLSALILFGFVGCHRKDNRVAEETLWVAERLGFHYLEIGVESDTRSGVSPAQPLNPIVVIPSIL